MLERRYYIWACCCCCCFRFVLSWIWGNLTKDSKIAVIRYFEFTAVWFRTYKFLYNACIYGKKTTTTITRTRTISKSTTTKSAAAEAVASKVMNLLESSHFVRINSQRALSITRISTSIYESKRCAHIFAIVGCCCCFCYSSRFAFAHQSLQR